MKIMIYLFIALLFTSCGLFGPGATIVEWEVEKVEYFTSDDAIYIQIANDENMEGPFYSEPEAINLINPIIAIDQDQTICTTVKYFENNIIIKNISDLNLCSKMPYFLDTGIIKFNRDIWFYKPMDSIFSKTSIAHHFITEEKAISVNSSPVQPSGNTISVHVQLDQNIVDYGGYYDFPKINVKLQKYNATTKLWEKPFTDYWDFELWDMGLGSPNDGFISFEELPPGDYRVIVYWDNWWNGEVDPGEGEYNVFAEDKDQNTILTIEDNSNSVGAYLEVSAYLSLGDDDLGIGL